MAVAVATLAWTRGSFSCGYVYVYTAHIRIGVSYALIAASSMAWGSRLRVPLLSLIN